MILGNNEGINRNQYELNNELDIKNVKLPFESSSAFGSYSLFSGNSENSLLDNRPSSSGFGYQTLSRPPGLDISPRVYCPEGLISSPSSYGSNSSFEVDSEIKRLNKENEDLKIKNKQTIDIIERINRAVIDSGFGNIGNLIKSANELKNTCFNYNNERINLIGIIEGEKLKRNKDINDKDEVIKRLESEIASNEKYILDQDKEINSIKKHIDVLHLDYQSKINGINVSFDRRFKVSEDSSFELDNSSKDLCDVNSENSSDNNSIRKFNKSKWNTYSDNICIDFCDRDKNYDTVRNKLDLLFKKAGILPSDFSIRNHIIIPKSKINEEKYRNMAYILCGNHVDALSTMNKIIECKSRYVKVYFSKPSSEF